MSTKSTDKTDSQVLPLTMIPTFPIEIEKSSIGHKEKIKAEKSRLEHKPWNHLDRGFRIRKIKEWIDTLNPDKYSPALKTELRKKLVKAIQRKEIISNMCVEYNTETCKVENVPAVLIVEDPAVGKQVIIRPPTKKTKRRTKK